MGDGSSYSEGVKSDGDINVGGDLDASVTASATSRSSETSIVVAEQLREGVDELHSLLAAQGPAGERALGEAIELRDEVAGRTALRSRIEGHLTAIEHRAGQITVVAAAIEVIRQVLGH